jgi:hypothetical protein
MTHFAPPSKSPAVPDTALTLVTEFFRDWKSPLADRGREIIKLYVPETA